MAYSALDKKKAIERELALRRRVYPNRVLTGRMTQAESDRQIRIFEELLADYSEREVAERLI